MQPSEPGWGGRDSKIFGVELAAMGWFYLMAWEWGGHFSCPHPDTMVNLELLNWVRWGRAKGEGSLLAAHGAGEMN